MSQLASYTASGQPSAKVSVSADLFGLSVDNHDLLKQAYQTHLNNQRPNLAQTKSRGQVRGGGRKPWRQKGTGRARAGTIRSPLWRGGGIVFGPTTERNYQQKLNQKQARLALKQALSLQLKQILVVAKFPTDAKTAKLQQLLTKLGCSRRILIVDQPLTEAIRRASSNLPTVELSLPDYLNVWHLMNSDWLVISKPALATLSQRLEVKDES